MQSRVIIGSLVAAIVGLSMSVVLSQSSAFIVLTTVLFGAAGAGSVAIARVMAVQDGLHREVLGVRTQATRIERRLKAAEKRAVEKGAVPRVARSTPPRAVDVTRDASTRATEVLGQLSFDGDRPSVVLLLQRSEPKLMFAGARTAILASAQMASDLDLRLRVVVVERTEAKHDHALTALADLIRDHSPYPHVAESLSLSSAHARAKGGHHAEDVWVATYWTTAYALNGLVRRGLVQPARVVYLIQDFEPAFYSWGDLYAKAFSTYRAGFRTLVNSRSLARYVENATGAPVDPSTVFAPAVEDAPLRRAAERWTPSRGGVTRVLFYARPSKPRNMYATGVQALREWVDNLPPGRRAVIRFAGEDFAGPVDLGPGAEVELLGKLSYEGYYDVLADTDIGLALMLSPHPGHLALELPMAGIPTVTNEFADYREAWVDGLEVSGGDPASIARALQVVAERSTGWTGHDPGPVTLDLGTSSEQAIAHVVSSLQRH